MISRSRTAALAYAGAALAVLALFGTGCSARASDEDPGVFRAWLAAQLSPSEATLRSFYQQREHQTAWLDRDRASGRAHQLVDALENAPERGLDPSDYAARELRQRVEAEGLSGPERFALELDLSRALLRYARHVASGRVDPNTLEIEWKAPARQVDLVKALALAADGSVDRAIESIEPAHPEYRALRDALARYREIAAEGGWKPMGRGAVLVPGRAAPGSRIAALAARLESEGYLGRVDALLRTGRKTEYDEALSDVVKRFQQSRGLEPDGVVGPQTVAELDASPAARIRSIELNLERWRWMRERTDRRQLLVRLPAYELRLVEDGKTDVAMRVIVGKQASKTPVLADRIEAIILNPYWNIPESIAQEEILPAIRKDPSWLSREQVEVIERSDETDESTVIDPSRVDWEDIDPASFPYRLRQRPGPRNPLGKIQFLFPNHFAVYLHDTPQGEAFDNTNRALSHGCIRVENPRLLAARLLRGSDWDEQRIDAALTGFERTEIRLAEPVPVYLLYETAFVDESGQIEFRRDIYGIDERLAALLAGKPAERLAAGKHERKLE